jgi:hypothetical protein
VPVGEDFFHRPRRQVPSIPLGIVRVLATTAGGKKTVERCVKGFSEVA